MKPTQLQIAAISVAINMYLNEEVPGYKVNSRKIISSWRHTILGHMPYSHNRQVSGWAGKDKYL